MIWPISGTKLACGLFHFPKPIKYFSFADFHGDCLHSSIHIQGEVSDEEGSSAVGGDVSAPGRV
jgi:hypothetical protein